MLRCTASQWVISVAPKSLAYQHDVDMVFGRPELFDVDDAKGIKKLTKSNDDHHKKLCRHVLESLEALDGITCVYDERSIMWTNKPLKQDINLTKSQPDLDDFLKESLKDSEAVLRILISKTKTIDLSSFPTSVVSKNEDRTWRTVCEMIFSEHPITRPNNQFISIGAGQLFENAFTQFDRGLIFRDGNRKGVQIVKTANKPQLCLSLDFCRKIFFPSNVSFLELVQNFMGNGGNYKEAEALFKKIKLCPIYNRARILTFKKFSDKSIRQMKLNDGTPLEEYYRTTLNAPLRNLDERAANMSNGHGDFPLELLQVLPNQPVPVIRMPDTLKEKALELNRLKPHERFALIQKQFQQLELNNPVTAAFGIQVNPNMIQGEFQRLPRMRMRVGGSNTVESNDQGAFRFDRNLYYKPAGFEKLVVFATRYESQKSIDCANAIVTAAISKGMQMPKPTFKEFNTSSQRLNDWLTAMNEYKGTKTCVLIIDKNQESHPIVKLAEARTGVQTQHLFYDTAFKVARGRPATLENIVHKLNIKAGGINHLVDFGPSLKTIKLSETLIISMDVSHPTGDDYKGSTDEPSTVGLVGNYLADPNEFAGIFFFQAPRQEAIDQTSLQINVKKMLQQAKKHRSIKNVILIRDAVSEGQYGQVLDDELASIEQSTLDVSIKAKIIGILVTKDGNTRHFNIANGQTSSMPPRSFVTFGSRFGFKQFFMTAHKSFAGTAKSVMITVIRDDIGLSINEVQTFLLGLTHMHQIVTAPVSIPAPLYQADVLAARGQKLFRALKKYGEREIPRTDDGIDYMRLSNLLNFNNGNLPITRYTA
uniref:Piwi domain-containing protein n=1 Tax=Panagrolaimus davidi TaxID=227884 RepID=A0A914R067_9BILA